MTINNDPLIVSEVFKISGRGIGVHFRDHPPVLLPLGLVWVGVQRSDGRQFEAAASVEAVRKVPPGEVLGLIFSNLEPSDVPQGSNVRFIDTHGS